MSQELKQAAFASLRLCMRPIARLLLRCGVTWKELAELCKVVYVEAATADYGKHGRPANSSRVAILTGLSRRELYQRALTNSTLQVIDRCGHSPALEKPQEFLRAVLDFSART